MTVKRVLFICTGNTCRSPMAAALFRQKAQAVGLAVAVASAGVYASQGAPASLHAVEAMSQRGISIADHKASTVGALQVMPADLLLTMTHGQARLLLSTYPHLKGQVHVLREYVGDTGADIRDPFGGDQAEYEATAQELEQLVARLIAKLQQQ